jgi:hypothetical protein
VRYEAACGLDFVVHWRPFPLDDTLAPRAVAADPSAGRLRETRIVLSRVRLRLSKRPVYSRGRVPARAAPPAVARRMPASRPWHVPRSRAGQADVPPRVLPFREEPAGRGGRGGFHS